MCYDYVHLDNLSDISAYRIELFLCPVPNQLQSRGVSPCIVTHLQALLYLVTVSGGICHRRFPKTKLEEYSWIYNLSNQPAPIFTFLPVWPFKERSFIGSDTPTIMNYYIQFALDTPIRRNSTHVQAAYSLSKYNKQWTLRPVSPSKSLHVK